MNALLIVPYSTDAVKPAAQMALANGIPTVGYDIQIEEPGIFYLSFDNAEVGRIQARGVVDIVNKGRFAYIKGSPTMEITEFVWGGQVEILTPYIEKGDIKIVCELYSDGWLPENAQINMEQCLTANDNNVDAVVASNDGTAGGVCQRRLKLRPKGGAKDCHLGWWSELGVRLGVGDAVRGFFGGSGQRSHAELKRSAPAARPQGGMVCRVGVSLATRASGARCRPGPGDGVPQFSYRHCFCGRGFG